MSEPTESIALMPKAKQPARLMKLAADSFANWILKRAVPFLREIKKRTWSLTGLKELKDWYWITASTWLGIHNSKSRYQVSASLMTVVDRLRSDTSPYFIMKLIIQAAFCCTVGLDENGVVHIIDHGYCIFLGHILRHIQPFFISELHDNGLVFECTGPLNMILQNSPHLNNVHLHFNSLPLIETNPLQRISLYVHMISIDIDTEFITHFCDIVEMLSRAFFDQMCIEEIKNNSFSKENVSVTCKNLKKFCIRCAFSPSYLPEFLACFLWFYSSIEVQVTSKVIALIRQREKLLPFISPVLLMETKNSSFLKPKVFFLNVDVLDWRNREGFNPLSIHSISWLINEFNINVYRIKEKISLETSNTMAAIYFRDEKPCIDFNMHSIGEHLQELIICGPLFSDNDASILVEGLNRCPNLQVLTLAFNINCNPKLVRLKPLKKLKVLSVTFANITPAGVIKVYDDIHIAGLLIPLVTASPVLRTLEMPLGISLKMLVNSGALSGIYTLVLKKRVSLPLGNIRRYLERLPSLEQLLFDRDFEYEEFLLVKKSLCNVNLEVTFKNDWYKPF